MAATRMLLPLCHLWAAGARPHFFYTIMIEQTRPCRHADAPRPLLATAYFMMPSPGRAASAMPPQADVTSSLSFVECFRPFFQLSNTPSLRLELAACAWPTPPSPIRLPAFGAAAAARIAGLIRAADARRQPCDGIKHDFQSIFAASEIISLLRRTHIECRQPDRALSATSR